MRLAQALLLGALPHRAGACFSDVLAELSAGSCMVRSDYSAANSSSSAATLQRSLLLPRFPVYVLHAPWLRGRHAHMRMQLVRLAAADVTWLTCANRDDVNAMSPQQRACAYPCVQLNRYFIKNTTTNTPVALANGTISLALKHKLACYDMLRRGLTAALILEDDAVLQPDLWAQMARLHIPADADMVWLGSYSRRTNVGTLVDHPRVPLPAATASPTPATPATAPSDRGSKVGDVAVRDVDGKPPIEVHRREAQKFPPILGAVGYVMLASGARLVATEPVTTAADIAISFYPRPAVNHTVGMAHHHAHAAHAHALGGAAGGGGHMRTFADGTCEDADGRVYVQQPPPRQYAPREWILWPVPPDQKLNALGDTAACSTHQDCATGSVG